MTHEAIDPKSTTPPTEPTFATIADLIPAPMRRWVYAMLGVWVPVFGVWVGAGNPPSWTGYITAGLGGAGFGVALSNVPQRVR